MLEQIFIKTGTTKATQLAEAFPCAGLLFMVRVVGAGAVVEFLGGDEGVVWPMKEWTLVSGTRTFLAVCPGTIESGFLSLQCPPPKNFGFRVKSSSASVETRVIIDLVSQ